MRWKGEKSDLTKVILMSLGTVAFVTVAVLMPNLVQLIPAYSQQVKPKRKEYYINRVLKRLNKQGLVSLQKNKQNQLCVSITRKGEELLDKYELASFTLPKPKRWDKKYRLLIFDIKEKKRKVRDELRLWLNHLGFIKLQNSVWVFPYDCEEVIALLKSHFHIGREVLYLTVESIENDKWLQQEFNLQS